NYYGDPYAANMTMLDHETGSPSDSSSDNEGYDDVNFMGNSVGRVSQLSSSGGKRGEDSLMMHYSVAKSDDDNMLLKRNRNQEQSAAAPNNSKIVNISVNVNAWNPPVLEQYPKPRKVAQLSGHKTLNSGIGA
ncbi:polyadenylate-binding protein 2-A, partial [Trifolium medium]|nr:polyadenylate-binding protein 2-A [Trifolium medium]